MTPPLSLRTQQLVAGIFSLKDRADASQWLEQKCGNNLPFCNDYDEYQMERLRFAAIKLSQGNIQTLLQAIDAACMDWRDLLVAAGFGHDVMAHEAWAKDILRQP
jgi:hypothetical protein